MENFAVVDHILDNAVTDGCVFSFGGNLYVAETVSNTFGKNRTVMVYTKEEIAQMVSFTESESFLPVGDFVSERELKQPTIEKHYPKGYVIDTEELVGLPFGITFSRPYTTDMFGDRNKNFYCLEFPTINGNRNVLVAFKLPEDFKTKQEILEGKSECIILSKGSLCLSEGIHRFSLQFIYNGCIFESAIQLTNRFHYEDIIIRSNGTEDTVCGYLSEATNNPVRIPSIQLGNGGVRKILSEDTQTKIVFLPLKNFWDQKIYKPVEFYSVPPGEESFQWEQIYGGFPSYKIIKIGTIIKTPIKHKRGKRVCPGAPIKKLKF